jgi:hypothetical protein
MTDECLLHNMSVPSRSTVVVRRAELPGVRYSIDCRSLTGPVADALRSHGARAVLALLETSGGLLFKAALRRPWRRSVEHVAAERFTRALADAGIPERVGVFVTPDPGAPQAPPTNLATALAVLARRSGALYLPRRRFTPSLIVPAHVVLTFPEV